MITHHDCSNLSGRYAWCPAYSRVRCVLQQLCSLQVGTDTAKRAVGVYGHIISIQDFVQVNTPRRQLAASCCRMILRSDMHCIMALRCRHEVHMPGYYGSLPVVPSIYSSLLRVLSIGPDLHLNTPRMLPRRAQTSINLSSRSCRRFMPLGFQLLCNAGYTAVGQPFRRTSGFHCIECYA